MSATVFSAILGLAPGETSGWTGRILACVALAAGGWKCFSIARRPTTNAKCVVSLAFVLAAWFVSILGLAAMDLFGGELGVRLIGALDGFVVLVFSLVAFILAIIGLLELRGKRDLIQQGRAQAIWALIISTILASSLMAGFIKGVINSGGSARGISDLGPISAPGTNKFLTFDDRNFRFQAPGRPWVSLKPSLINKDSQLVFTRSNPQMYFLVIAEDLGGNVINSTEQYVGLAKARMESTASSESVVGEVPMSIGDLRGVCVKHTAVVKNLSLFFEQWFCVTNGWGFQLTGWGRSNDEKLITAQLPPIFKNFEMIDPNRIASSGHSFATNFVSIDLCII